MQQILRTRWTEILAFPCFVFGAMLSPLFFLLAAAMAWPSVRRGRRWGLAWMGTAVAMFLLVTGYGIGKDLALHDAVPGAQIVVPAG